jgi:hypothetical protein
VSPLSLLIWLSLTFLLLLFLKQWITQHMQGIVLLLSHNEDLASLMYFIVLLPGVLLHEGSHWLVAKLLRVRTGKLSIGLSQRRGGQLEMGSLQVAKTDPIRGSLIGVAPLVGGILAIFVIGWWALGVDALARMAQNGDPADIASGLWRALQVPDFWLWLYLIFAISNAMLPSTSDRRSWPLVLVFLAVLVSVLYLTDWLPSPSSGLLDVLSGALSHLNLAFTLTLAVDVIFALLILLAESLLSRLTGWRVEY